MRPALRGAFFWVMQATGFVHTQSDPFFNMAFDEAMLAHVMTHPETALVRFYTWKPGTITFGFNQDEARAYDHRRIGETPVIRRITGGRAIYHDPGEITYAFAVDTAHDDATMFGQTIKASSLVLAEVLRQFVQAAGRSAELVERSSPENARPDFFHTAPCFVSKARFELMSGAQKVVASAQVRKGTCLLQHGSIKLNGVVGHPALGGNQSDLHRNVNYLPENELSAAFETLSDVFARHLGVRVERSDSSHPVEKMAQDRRVMVQKKACERRVIF